MSRTRRITVSRRPYPHNKDIAEAIARVISRNEALDPLEFPGEVREELGRMGFFPGLVSAKRIWRIYEEMVRRGWIVDRLDVLDDTPH
jgi:hypothetical protein